MSASSTPSTGPAPAAIGAKAAKAGAALLAVAALVFGASQIAKSDGTSTGAVQASQQQPGGMTGAQPDGSGAGPQGGMTPPGMGAEVTGSTLSKLEAAATAKYPGEVERAMQLADGSYVVHVIQSNGDGELHVLVSRDFEVTGVEQGGPPSGAVPPSGQSAPGGASSSSSSQSS